MRKLLIILLALLAISYFLSPYFILGELIAAAERRDVAEVMQHVDFPAVKASLKANLRQKVSNQNLSDEILDPLLENLITPETVAQLLPNDWTRPIYREKLALTPDSITALARKGKLSLTDTAPSPDDNGVGTLLVAENEGELDWSAHYRGLHDFRVRLASTDGKRVYLEFDLHRSGFSDWRIVAVRFL